MGRRTTAFGAATAISRQALQQAGNGVDGARPPRLTDGPLTGAYRTATGQNLRRGLLVSRADVAHLMLRAVGQPATVKQVIGVAR